MLSSLTAGTFLSKYKPNLTYNADHSCYSYFLFSQEVTEDRIYVDPSILKWQILKASVSQEMDSRLS